MSGEPLIPLEHLGRAERGGVGLHVRGRRSGLSGRRPGIVVRPSGAGGLAVGRWRGGVVVGAVLPGWTGAGGA